jgi:hypothetical protein
LKKWPCKRTWEAAAIDCLTREDCQLILNEVFDCDDLQALIARGDAFFAQMPDIGMKLKYSPSSPLSESFS